LILLVMRVAESGLRGTSEEAEAILDRKLRVDGTWQRPGFAEGD